MMSDNIKLVLAGPVGAGKSTAIASLSDTPPVTTEMPMLDGPMGEKTTTTVAMDFSMIHLEDEAPLFVYGLPGQEHFSFMRSIVLEGALGVILLLNAASPSLEEDCAHWLDSITESHPDIAIVIGITHADTAMDFSLSDIRQIMRQRKLMLPTLTIDARDKAQMYNLVRALLSEITP